MEELTDKETKVIDEIRKKGYAVVIFNEEELAGASSDYVEERLIELGWGVIEDLKA